MEETTDKEVVDFVKSKMWHHLPNGTCTNCGKSYTGGVYKKILDKLMCEKCVIMLMILHGASVEEVKMEKQKANSEK